MRRIECEAQERERLSVEILGPDVDRFTSRTSNGFSIHRTAAADGSRGARPCSGRVQGKCAKIHGWYVSLGKHEKARRYWCAWHVGSRTIWRPWLAGRS